MEGKSGNKKKKPGLDGYFQHKQLAALEKKIAELEALKKKYSHLKALHDLQNSTVRHFMHNIMSPLSAVSGYLELLANNLDGDVDTEKLGRYSTRIGDGLNEIGFLLEQLHEIYKDEQPPGGSPESPVVELNWLVQEVETIVSNSTDIRSKEIVVLESEKPVYVEAELFQLKLMIYNLMTTVDQLSTKSSSLAIEINGNESEFALILKGTGEVLLDDSLKRVLHDKDIVRLTDDIEEDSSILLGLKICAQISDQMKARIIIDKRNQRSPQFILTGPTANPEG
ncbi:MAG: hypothetical protein GVY08_12050 [Bacteroidetes bacterium]|jgi:K+-sensing histidine kinase KdpD|nr:hypothetical protein [Bacteroidota bacterium]